MSASTARRLHLTASFTGAAGLALFLFLLGRYGWGDVLAAVAAAGWAPLLITLYRFLTIATDAAGWQAVFPFPQRPPLRSLLPLRWVGEAANSLLPVAQVGGDVIRARLAARRFQMPRSSAAASVVVDFTLGLATQALYTLLGVVLLIITLGRRANGGPWFLGLFVALAVLALFYFAQRRGMFSRLTSAARFFLGGDWEKQRLARQLHAGAENLDRFIHAIYSHRRAVFLGGTWRFATWLLHTGETWIILYFLGVPASLSHALILESLGTAIRSAAFIIPAGLGVQEGGFLLLGVALGIPPEAALALSLIRRVRELLVGGPGLVVWMVLEAGSFSRAFSKRFSKS